MQRDGKFVVNRRNMSRRSSPFLGRFLQSYSGSTSIFVDGLLALSFVQRHEQAPANP